MFLKLVLPNRKLCNFVQQTLLQLGTIQISMKDYGGALASLQEALKIRRSASSKLLDSRQTDARNKNLRQIGDTLSRLGLLHFETEEYLSAAAAFEDALLTYRSCLSQESCPHTVIAETLINLGSVRCKRKQYSEAIVAFDEAVMVCYNFNLFCSLWCKSLLLLIPFVNLYLHFTLFSRSRRWSTVVIIQQF
jgi:tetratricopeptide (TPR) repeat protein